jgi:hypothetical protein
MPIAMAMMAVLATMLAVWSVAMAFSFAPATTCFTRSAALALALAAAIFAVTLLTTFLATFPLALRVLVVVLVPLAIAGQERHDAHPGLNSRFKIGSLPTGSRCGTASSQDDGHTGPGDSGSSEVGHGTRLRWNTESENRLKRRAGAGWRRGPRGIERGSVRKVSAALILLKFP